MNINSTQKDILHETENFYSQLFSNKDHLTKEADLEKEFEGYNINKLNHEQQISIEDPISLGELSNALKSTLGI